MYPVLEAQDKYPDVKFIIIDAAPTDPNEGQRIREKCRVYLLCRGAGWLSGWLCSSSRRLYKAWIHGRYCSSRRVIRYGYGFIQGADAAAKELGVEEVSMKYTM